jgi:hypothetical protein
MEKPRLCEDGWCYTRSSTTNPIAGTTTPEAAAGRLARIVAVADPVAAVDGGVAVEALAPEAVAERASATALVAPTSGAPFGPASPAA